MAHAAFRAGQPVDLTARERTLFEVLLQQPETVISKAQLETGSMAPATRWRATPSRFMSAGSARRSATRWSRPCAAWTTGWDVNESPFSL